MIKRRPLLLTPWTIWVKPRLKIRYHDIRFHLEHGTDDQGRIRVQIVDESDREYWLRMTPWQYAFFCFFQH